MAQWCARRGWPVFPLAAGAKTPVANCQACRENAHLVTDCPCLRTGRGCHGFHAATLSQERIQQWWGPHPEYGVGVSCGPAGLLVVDIDAHTAEQPARDRLLPGIPIGDQVDLTGLANGFHTLAVLAALRGQASPADDATTLRVRTPSGGMHVWYRVTGPRHWLSSAGSSPRRALSWQVDIRAQGSYIIAPGTTTKRGPYVPVGVVREPAPLPVWLAQELQRTGHLPTASIPAPRPVPPRAQQAVLAAGGGRSAVQSFLASVLADIKACGQVEEGAGFSEVLNRAAYTLGGLVAAGRLSQEEAERTLTETACVARPGQERRIDQIIRSGLSAGLKRPLYATGRHP
ncbi:bifunctional DNA primase/polymerase [Streptomyces spongiae]|uniref:Bifunctional DNA primase/polymerase n=1 Tax=Streptomyces spongiae TaxID=565072 RepID=A0A5N8XH12_9ACTN|nr:bifunctional DNA primase/polymerase [Streptomyces spongiae]MPY58800.1 bifunctional DNA primase/polymerase [Streptomyces spongiae]